MHKLVLSWRLEFVPFASEMISYPTIANYRTQRCIYHRALRAAKQSVSEVPELMAEMDKDNDGKITFEEFAAYWKDSTGL